VINTLVEPAELESAALRAARRVATHAPLAQRGNVRALRALRSRDFGRESRRSGAGASRSGEAVERETACPLRSYPYRQLQVYGAVIVAVVPMVTWLVLIVIGG
jgi:hypothetical protein